MEKKLFAVATLEGLGVFFGFPGKIGPVEYCLWELDWNFYLYIVSLMCQSVNRFVFLFVYC